LDCWVRRTSSPFRWTGKPLALLLVPLALSGTAGTARAAQQPEPVGVDLHAVRFFRSGGRTVVDAFARVPFSQLDRLPSGGAAYRVTVAVHDSTGLELLRQAWGQRVGGAVLIAPHAAAVEHFTFTVNAGRFDVQVRVVDSASGRVIEGRLPVQGFAGPQAASDLMLATGMRAAASAADTVANSGEVRKGPVFLAATPWPALTPRQTALAYYLELYGRQGDTATIRLEVRRGNSDSVVVRIAEQRIPLDTLGRASRASLDLAGLPPGHYRLVAVLSGAAGSEERSAGFDMRGFGTDEALAAAVPEQVDAYTNKSEAQLDSLYGPLLYVMNSDEQGLYTGLSVDGKRAYLRRFWAKRDPTPGTPLNEAAVSFYQRIAEAERRFGEGGVARVPGWRTDRGRIFIKYGAPDEVLDRPQAGNSNPYLVWKYTRGRPLKYVFMDQTQFGNYALIYTDDRREPSRPNWQALLGPQGVLDVQRF
jgi:GWxTD domain-containing protein